VLILKYIRLIQTLSNMAALALNLLIIEHSELARSAQILSFRTLLTGFLLEVQSRPHHHLIKKFTRSHLDIA